MTALTDLSFDVLRQPRGTGYAATARFLCYGCGAKEDMVLRPGTMNPEAITKRLRLKGWDADPWRRNRIRCPACLGKHKTSELTRSPIESRAEKMAALQTEIASVREAIAALQSKSNALSIRLSSIEERAAALAQP